MTQKYWEQKPTSFADTVELVKNYVKTEIIRETERKQLYYHNLDHALAVERRARFIFQAIKPVLLEDEPPQQLQRLEQLIGICGLAHDAIQIFEPTALNRTRKRRSGDSEIETANKLICYIDGINQALATEGADSSLQFSDRERLIIRDSIIATICTPDPQGNLAKSAFSTKSLYQPYLYDTELKTSLAGRIVALADLGTLGIDGVEAYIHDGILIFLEDNPHLQPLLFYHKHPTLSQEEVIPELLAMARFIIDFARERLARFEREIAAFSPQIRQILRERIFIHLNQQSIQKVEKMIPSHSDASFSELSNFFSSDKIQLTDY